MLPELIQRLVTVLEPITKNFEIVLVDDGSPDDSWNVILAEHKKDARIKGIKFCRNFGQHHALTAGLDVAQGEWVVTMDSDLQDLPEEIPRLYEKALEGFDVVLARRGKRKDSWLKRVCNWGFYKIFNYLSGMRYDREVGGFRIVSQKVVHTFRQMREQHRFMNGLMEWMGFSTASINVKHAARPAGESSYNFRKLFVFAVDIITSYSNRPLRLSIGLGFFMALISFVIGIYYLVHALLYGSTVSGWSSLIVSLYFLSGVIMMVLGVIGLYLGKIFTELKGRPIYIVSETT